MGAAPLNPRYLVAGEHTGSITGYFVAVPSNAGLSDLLDDAIAVVFSAPVGRTCVLLFSTENAATEFLKGTDYALHRLLDGDEAIMWCREAGLSLALDARNDGKTDDVHYTAVTRDPAKDGPVDKRALGAALIDPEGNVIDVLMIMSATEEELREAERHAESRGFALVVHERVVVCSDEASLRAVIASEAHA